MDLYLVDSCSTVVKECRRVCKTIPLVGDYISLNVRNDKLFPLLFSLLLRKLFSQLSAYFQIGQFSLRFCVTWFATSMWTYKQVSEEYYKNYKLFNKHIRISLVYFFEL